MKWIFPFLNYKEAVTQADPGLFKRVWKEVCEILLDYLKKILISPKIPSIFSLFEYLKCNYIHIVLTTTIFKTRTYQNNWFLYLFCYKIYHGNLAPVHLIIQVNWINLNEIHKYSINDLFWGQGWGLGGRQNFLFPCIL